MISGRPRRHWLLDMENIQTRWARILPLMAAEDSVTVFCSPAVNRIDMDPLCAAGTEDVAFYFARCANGVPNAMDFQMMVELGRLSVKDPEAEYIIVSADKGFESVMAYMSARNIRIDRLDPDMAPDHPEAQPDAPAHGSGPAANPDGEYVTTRSKYRRLLMSAGMSDADDLRITAGIIFAVMAGPPSWRKLGVRNRLRSRYGAAIGEAKYTAIKDVVYSIIENGPYPTAEELAAATDAAPQAPETPPQTPFRTPKPGEINSALSSAHVALSKGTVAKATQAIRAARLEPDKRAALERLLAGTVQRADIKKAAGALMRFL